MIPFDIRTQAQPLMEDPDETVEADAESLWIEEIRLRDAEIRAGTAKLKPAEQVLREARELLNQLPPSR